MLCQFIPGEYDYMNIKRQLLLLYKCRLLTFMTVPAPGSQKTWQRSTPCYYYYDMSRLEKKVEHTAYHFHGSNCTKIRSSSITIKT